MEIKEKAFPRGGKKPAFLKSKKDPTYSLFKKPKVKPKQKRNKAKQVTKESAGEKAPATQLKQTLELKYVEDLKASVLQDEMLVLGIVSQVTEKIVNVSLPGRLRGIIAIAHVSKHYTSLIENVEQIAEVPSLKNIFQEGDVLPVKILSVSNEHSSLMLTSDPKSINQKLSYSLIEEGFILVGSVTSKEDHGYIVDFGIENVCGFLHNEKVEKNKNICVGQLLKCCVMQCNKSPGSCNLQLSMLKKDIQSAVIKKNSTLPIHCFVPGFQFEVTVEKKLFNGVKVTYRKGNSPKAFIYEDHLLKKFPNLSDVEVGSRTIGTLLYVKPLINFLYFKIMPKKKLEWPFKYGDKASGKVVQIRNSGIIVKVIEGAKKAKCFVHISKLKNANQIEDKSTIVSSYPVGKKMPAIRLGNVDYMGRFYLGAIDKESLTEKYYSVSDLKCGEIVSCKIISFGKSSARLKIGKTITGLVGFTDMSDVPMRNPGSKFKVGQDVKARVKSIIPEKRFVRLTMKPSLLKESNILCNVKKIEKDKSYVGTVLRVTHKDLKVGFFNEISGTVPQHLTPFRDLGSLTENFYVGQLVKCFVVSVKKNGQLLLSLTFNHPDTKVELGKKYKATVVSVTNKGLILDVAVEKKKKCNGYLPAVLLTPHHSLASAYLPTYSAGEKLTVYCVSNTQKHEPFVFGAVEVFAEFYEGKSEEELQKMLQVDSVVPFLFKNKSLETKTLFLTSIIPGKSYYLVKVVTNDTPDSYYFSKYQLVYGKILKLEDKRMKVSISLNRVWNKDFNTSLDLLNSYLKSMDTLVTRQKKLNAYSEDLSLGCPVKGTTEEVRTNCAVVRLETGDLGLIEGKFTEGQEVSGKVVWIDGPQQMIHVIRTNNTPKDNSTEGVFVPDNDNLRGKIVFISNEVIVVELKGRGNEELAFIPRKRHLNDFITPTDLHLSVGEKLKLWITRKDSNYILGIDRQIISMQEKITWKQSEAKLKDSVRSLKRKLELEKIERNKKQKNEPESDDLEVVNVKLKKSIEKGDGDVPEDAPEIKEEVDVDGEVFNVSFNGIPRLEYDDLDIKSEDEVQEKEEKESTSVRPNNEERIILSSSSESEGEEEDGGKTAQKSKALNVGFNWEVLNNHSLLSGVTLKRDESSSDDDDDDESKSDKKKKRRLTASEKWEKAKSEEERLRFVEERLMDVDREPETADDFDRAVLSNPDSSALWLKYMAFHIQGTEIEKARAVAKRALKAISFREEQEKLNVWIALLNLENMYGNDDSLNRTLAEALQSNEPYKIHLHMLNVHGEGNKFQEMEKLGNFMLKKYKNMENMWHEVGSAYFSVGKVESARNVLQRALTVVDKSCHIPLISKFAQLENKHGSPERAQTLYESILASYPKRVDIWSCYVDMLIKSNHIDLARQVLERATSQSLRPRKMKILFKKFLTFEETHGTPENVEKVREAAVEYVQTVGATDY